MFPITLKGNIWLSVYNVFQLVANFSIAYTGFLEENRGSCKATVYRAVGNNTIEFSVSSSLLYFHKN